MKLIIGTYRADHDMMVECITSLDLASGHVSGVDELIFVDDSGDEAFRRWLGGWGKVHAVGETNQGYAKAMEKVCEVMRDLGGYVGFWEEDFTARGDIDFGEIIEEMTPRPNLAQVVLLRQPWFEGEIETGSVIRSLSERLGGTYERVGPLVMHDMTFSCNPAVWAPMAYRWPWPQCNDSEDFKTRYLVDDDNACFAFWTDEVTVEHDGERQGRGY